MHTWIRTTRLYRSSETDLSVSEYREVQQTCSPAFLRESPLGTLISGWSPDWNTWRQYLRWRFLPYEGRKFHWGQSRTSGIEIIHSSACIPSSNAPAYPARIFRHVRLRQNPAKLAKIGQRSFFNKYAIIFFPTTPGSTRKHTYEGMVRRLLYASEIALKIACVNGA